MNVLTVRSALSDNGPATQSLTIAKLGQWDLEFFFPAIKLGQRDIRMLVLQFLEFGNPPFHSPCQGPQTDPFRQTSFPEAMQWRSFVSRFAAAVHYHDCPFLCLVRY